MPRPIDHLVLAVRDLGGAADLYRQLGFRVGDRNRHPWGTQNHIVQLHGSFLELIGLAPDFRRLGDADPAAPFADRLAAFLERREGLAQVALQSRDARADADAFAAPDAAPGCLCFGRTAVGADGIAREVAFSLAFAPTGPGGESEFFACQHHRPENFWSPVLQQHPNSARRLIGVLMAAGHARTSRDVLQRMFGRDALTLTDDGLVAAAAGQTIEILPDAVIEARYGVAAPGTAFVGYRIGVASLSAVRSVLSGSGLRFEERRDRLIVGPAVARGAVLSFEAESKSGEGAT